MRLDPSRALKALGLSTWATTFMWLWLSGEQVRFIGPKTAWVVPFGAIALTLAAVAYLATVVTRDAVARPAIGEMLGTILLITPVLLLATVPDPSLGALAAQRKGAKNIRLSAPTKSGRYLDVFAVAYAGQDPEFARKIGAVPGQAVSLRGLLADRDASTPDFDVVRFRIRCCAADATPYAVTVWPGNGASVPDTGQDDQWVAVDGVLTKGSNGTLQVQATAIKAVASPARPYN
jgi:uncharacterized repeat protein (TIGR03943 family)